MSPGFDKNFIKRCKKGDAKALEELYRKTSSTLLGVCLRYTKNIQDAEDVFHEGFIKILKKINQVNDENKILSWMIRIMANTAINFLKKNKKLAEDDFEDNLDYNEDNGNDEIIKNDDNLILNMISEKELYKLIENLPDGYRIVLNLYAIEGYTHKEIAEMLGISVSTSKTQYQKAKNKLKQAIEKKLSLNKKH